MAELRVIPKTQCGNCGKFFSSLTAFDFHLVGEISKGRVRCLSTKELREVGYATEQVLVKMYLDGKPVREPHDAWYSVADREKVRQAFGRGDAEDEEGEQ